jgi:uncharacterized protein YdeI (YjbR/CyaY-like superfamily)
MIPQFDSYIERSADFAQPILNHLRSVVHEACPMVEEKMKWSFPNFEYKGKILCSMAAFKHHCTFGFWLGGVMDDPESILTKIGESTMGQFGRIKTMEDLPNDQVIIRYIHEAMRLTDEGVKPPKSVVTNEKVVITIPIDLENALKANDKAKATFEHLSPSKRKEYIEWINEAKTDTTKEKRLATTIEWLEEGKSKNWKYERK